MKELDEKDFSMGSENSSRLTKENFIIEERKGLKLDKFRRRFSIIFILITFFIIIIFSMAYLDIKKSLSEFQDTGVLKVQDLSKTLESKMSELSKRIDNIEKSLKSSDKAKVDKKDLISRINELKKSVVPTEQKLKELAASFNDFKDSSKESLAEVNRSIADTRADIDKLKEEIAGLWTSKVDQTMLSKALEDEKNIYRDMTGLITQKLEAKIEDLEQKIYALQKQISLIKKISSKQTYDRSAPGAGNSDIFEQNIKD